MTATSYGTGQLIAAAIDAGCRKVILGIGGSASTDGGAGLVHALTGTESLDLPALRRRLRGVEIVVACDVDNPLTGPNGCRGGLRPAEGRRPPSRSPISTPHSAAGPTSSPARPAATCATRRALAQQVGWVSPRSRSWAPTSARGSSWCLIWSASTSNSPARIW